MVLWKTGAKYSTQIHAAGSNEECHVVFLRVDLTLFVNFISQKQVVVIVVY